MSNDAQIPNSSESTIEDQKRYGRQTLAVQKMLPDIKKILLSKFDCRKMDIDELVSEVCLSMLSNRDYNAHRGGASTYIYYKCQSVWLNHKQKQKRVREDLCETGEPEDQSNEISELEFNPEEFESFLKEIHGQNHPSVKIFEQLRLGHHIHLIRHRLKMSVREFSEARKTLTKSGKQFLAEIT